VTQLAIIRSFSSFDKLQNNQQTFFIVGLEKGLAVSASPLRMLILRRSNQGKKNNFNFLSKLILRVSFLLSPIRFFLFNNRNSIKSIP